MNDEETKALIDRARTAADVVSSVTVLRHTIRDLCDALSALSSHPDEEMVERMALILHAQTKEGRDGWSWPVNEFQREGQMKRARVALHHVLGLPRPTTERNETE